MWEDDMHVRFWWAKGKESLGRPRHRQQDNVHADLTAGGGENADWLHLAQDSDTGRLL
jgi:hypothetical protein